MINPNNQYTKLQQHIYDGLALDDAGQIGFRPNEPKSGMVQGLMDHNDHLDYEIYLWKDISDWKSKIVLDFGCGPGRNLIKYHDRFQQIDGVDIAQQNLEIAQRWIKGSGLDLRNFKLIKNNGIDLKEIEDESYDVVMSTICLQHISVYEIRFNLLKEFYRVLRPNGYITLQLLLSSDKPGTVKYYDNHYDAQGTNGAADCVVENIEYVKDDLEKNGFGMFHSYVRPTAIKGRPSMDNEWLFVNAQKVAK